LPENPSSPSGHELKSSSRAQFVRHELKPLDIVLVNTRAGSCIGTEEYLAAGCGMGREATLYLTSGPGTTPNLKDATAGRQWLQL